jgi:type IV pilus assembly protein PilY1
MLAMKTAAGIALSALGPDVRVGFHTLGTYDGHAVTFGNVADFDASRKEAWFARMYATPVAPNNTAPVADAMWRIGEYFANRATDLTGAADPLDAATGKCQSNDHLLALGGYAGTPLNAALAVGNRDRIVPTLPAPVPGLAPGEGFPRPYYEGPTATSDTLADLAMTYWAGDLRPDLADQVGDAFAPWQHLSFHAFSLGARATLEAPAAIAAIRSGAADWPAPAVWGGPETIDDLLHATINGRGRFASAASASELVAAFAGTLAAIADASTAGTGAAITVSSSTTATQFAYRTSFAAGGWGDVRKYALDAATGAIPLDANGNPAHAPLWSAAAQLDEQSGITGTPPAQVAGWDANRKIVTINDATGDVVPFRLGNLSAAQRTSLTAGWQASDWQPTAQQVVDYLRGDPSNEGNAAHQFRVRSHLLGDIVHSAAVPVGAPNLAYDEAANPGHATFGRPGGMDTMVYVGASDGSCTPSSIPMRPPMPARKPGPSFRKRCSRPAIRTMPRTPRRRISSSARSRTGREERLPTRTGSTSTRRHAPRMSISRTRTPRRLPKAATTGARC